MQSAKKYGETYHLAPAWLWLGMIAIIRSRLALVTSSGVSPAAVTSDAA